MPGGSSGGARSTSSARRTPQQAAQFRQRFGAPIPGLVAFGRTIDIVGMTLSRGQDQFVVQLFSPEVNQLYTIAHQRIIPALP